MVAPTPATTPAKISARRRRAADVPAAGLVAMAEPLNVRGNAVVIDHGRGIFTGYWDLSEIKVTVGQELRTGDLIGLVGTTGLSTGAHLHWELRIYGIAVDPMQFVTERLSCVESPFNYGCFENALNADLRDKRNSRFSTELSIGTG